jgi:trans-aconitate 2-methyltransferase
MPDNLDEPAHVLMREVAQLEPWREMLAETARVRDNLPKPGVYYDALSPLCTRLEIWHTIYNHVLDDAAAIVEWVKGTGLRPFVDPLEPPERKAYLAEYTARIAASYLPQADGKVLLRFPRIFIVAVR